MRFLLDENVPASVAEVLEEFGHTATFVRDILPAGAADQVVALTSEIDGAVLVSCDSDFRALAPRIPHGSRQRFRTLSRIHLKCPEPRAAQRIRAAMSLIEAEYVIAQAQPDTRMIIEIQRAGIKTLR